MPKGSAIGVSLNSICMSMMCVMPKRATSDILSAVQMPPPTAMRSVIQERSIVELLGHYVVADCRIADLRNCRIGITGSSEHFKKANHKGHKGCTKATKEFSH